MERLISRRQLAFRLMLVALFLSTACLSNRSQPTTAGAVEMQRDLMGTIVSVQTYGLPAQEAKPAIEHAFAAIEELQRLAHPQWESSEIFQLNHQAGISPVKLSPPIYEIVALAHEVSVNSHGAFDVTYAGVGRLYNLQDPQASLPTTEQLAAALRTIDYRKLVLSASDQTAFLPAAGMQVNLGGIAKGWSAQSAMAALKERGVQNAIVNAGGDMTIIGSKNGEPWKVGIQHPRKPRGELYAVMHLSGEMSVATSGDYERFIIRDGVRYHHIMDPRTGKPADKCRSVTILAPTGDLADALATAVFVLGPQEGLAMLREHYPQCEAMVLDDQGQEHATSDFAAKTRLKKVTN